MSFKIGEKVKIIDIYLEHSSGQDYLGQIGVIVKDRRKLDRGYKYWVKFSDGVTLMYGLDEVERILPPQFIVTYDEVNRDPYKVFSTRKGLNKWLEEAQASNEVIFGSIKVFEIKKELELKIELK